MASPIPAVLLLTTALFVSTVADDCDSYFNNYGLYIPSKDCSFIQFCCGTCNNRYCCSNPLLQLREDECDFHGITGSTIRVVSGIVGSIIFVIIVITCCVCPCCCLYKLCRKPRPIMTTTTVLTSQYPQQPTTNPAAVQFPSYQPIPPQPGYGGHVMPPAAYPAQPYAPGAPPPYQESGYPAPYSQAAFEGGQPPYPMNPPIQPGYAHPPPPTNYNPVQPPYNPAYVDLPKTGN